MDESKALATILSTLERMQGEIRDLTRKVDTLMSSDPPAPITGGPWLAQVSSYFPEILDGLSYIVLESVPSEIDPLAYATGYLTGKLGLQKDHLGETMDDYSKGWDVGNGVYHGDPNPIWDSSDVGVS